MTKNEEIKDVAVQGEHGVAVVGADLFNMGDNMEGVEAVLPQVKIIHQGQMFVMPDGNKVQAFSGTVIDMNRTNAYWEVSFDESGGGDPPTCSSLNGITPDMSSAEIQSENGGCPGCPKNVFGSDGKRGKLCKNMKRMHVLMDGSMIPYRLTVPPSNLKVVDLYVSLLTAQGIPYQLIETEFGLRSVKNKDGIEYSELILRNVGPSKMIRSREDAMKMKALIAQWKHVMRGGQVLADEI